MYKRQGVDRLPKGLETEFNEFAKIVFEELSKVDTNWDYSANRDSLLSHRVRSLANIFP